MTTDVPSVVVRRRLVRAWTRSRIACALVVVVCASMLTEAASHAQTVDAKPEESMAKDLHETIVRIDVTVADRFGRTFTRAMPITVFRPDGDGPHPLVVFEHGRAPDATRATQGRSRPEALARYFVERGFVVVAPTRIGYWETYGAFDPEAAGSCNDLRPQNMARVTADETLAAVVWATSQPDIDTGRWLVVGQSVGGLASIATVGRRPAGLVGGINFSGGAGGDPQVHPRDPCSPKSIEALYRRLGADAAVPMLWMYWVNDLYWGESVPSTWFAAWQGAGGRGTMQTFPARGENGHAGVNIDLDHWVPAVDAFLTSLGFTVPAATTRPAPSGYAPLDDVDRLPGASEGARVAYRRFLAAPSPRAFALGDRGAYGFAVNDDVLDRALGFCAHTGETCKLYAVDGDVVWQ